MKTLWLRLIDDPRTWEAIDSMLPEHFDIHGRAREVRTQRGCLPEDQVFPLLRHIAELPTAWETLQEEHPDDSKKRRELLARKIKKLSEEIANDPQASQLRIINSHEITSSKLMYKGLPCRTISEFLSDFADSLETRRTVNEQLYKSIRGSKSTRDSLKEYVQREVVSAVYSAVGRPKQCPRSAMAKLINALLGLIGNEEVKGTDLAHI